MMMLGQRGSFQMGGWELREHAPGKEGAIPSEQGDVTRVSRVRKAHSAYPRPDQASLG